MDKTLLQGLEVELRSIQAHSLQSEGYLVQLDDRLSSLSNSAGKNLTSLSTEMSRTTRRLRDYDVLLRCTIKQLKCVLCVELEKSRNTVLVCGCFREASGHVNGLREKLDEVNWTVGAVNHTFSNDISIHHFKIQDLQVRSSSHGKRDRPMIEAWRWKPAHVLLRSRSAT